ncbi:WhiB family transcriptional regulator [Microbacterium sp. 22303]|uniref:WhiB family transcriptional regulator n=1 Tax=Microbacterium sp. 22303 TaxID=3453905 RepID=UPI003F874D1F
MKRSEHSIRVWRQNGMPMEWRTDDTGQRFRVVREDVLLAWWRDRMKASPVHFYRLRKDRRTAGLPDLSLPTSVTGRKGRGHLQVPEDASDAASEAYTSAQSHVDLAPLLADLPEFVGQHAHAALVRAMEDSPPACDGLDGFTRDRFDDPEETAMMRGICRACSLLELCEAFAIAGRPAAGMWAGMTPADIRRTGSVHAA